MTWNVLVSAPYFLPVMETYRQRLAEEGVELIGARVNERLSEDELIEVIKDIDGIICGDDRITERVLAEAPRRKRPAVRGYLCTEPATHFPSRWRIRF